MSYMNLRNSVVLIVLLFLGLVGLHAGEETPSDILTPRIVILGSQIAKGSGCIAYAKGLTLMRAIAAAGGITDFGGRTTVYLIRQGKPTKVSFLAITKNSSKDIPLEPWDIILLK